MGYFNGRSGFFQEISVFFHFIHLYAHQMKACRRQCEKSIMIPLWLRPYFKMTPKMAWFSHAAMTLHQANEQHPDVPERLVVLEQMLKEQNIWQHLLKCEAGEIDDATLSLVHTPAYLQYLESMQPSQQGQTRCLDNDTVLNAHTLYAARVATACVVKAVDYVLEGKVHHAFCAVRPPGHHAFSDRAGGFCVFNHVAVGAMHALLRHRVKKLAIIDFDVHRGDGTEAIFADDERVLLLGMSQNTLYPYQDAVCMGKNPHRYLLNLSAGTSSRVFREQVRQQWLPYLQTFQPEMILLSAGFDAHYLDPLSDVNLHEADYAWLTHQIMRSAPQCRGKIVSVLEGGYHLQALANSAAAHIYVLSGMGKPDCAVHYHPT